MSLKTGILAVLFNNHRILQPLIGYQLNHNTFKHPNFFR